MITMLQKKENDDYIHTFVFEVTSGGMAVKATPHITHNIRNVRGTYQRRLSCKEVTKEDGNKMYKELVLKGYKKIR
jgi:hypothetical protein